MVDAERGAFGAVRVMVNCNQVSEAAAVACHLALEARSGVAGVDVGRLRKARADGGSLTI